MFNVSFGDYNYKSEIRPNRQQKIVENYIDSVVDPDWVECKIKESKTGRKASNLIEVLSNEKQADLFVKLNKDGKFEIQVQKDVPSPLDDVFVPYARDGKSRLKTIIDSKLSMKTIRQKMNDFMKKALDYAQKPDTEKNEEAEWTAMVKAEAKFAKAQNQLTPEAEKYLAKLSDEEDFIEEFGLEKTV